MYIIKTSSMPADAEYKYNHETKRRCAYCGTEASLVWVHGHGQCAACGTNIEDCCQGEQSNMRGRENEMIR